MPETYTSWIFYINEDAHAALSEAALIGDSMTGIINKALQVEYDALHARIFSLIDSQGYIPPWPEYEIKGEVCAKINVNLSINSVKAIAGTAAVYEAQSDDRYDSASLLLNNALQRYRDIIRGQETGLRVLIMVDTDHEPHIISYQ